MAPSPYIGISLIVIILIILLINFYFTWWVYNNYRSDQNDFDNAKEELRKMSAIILSDTGVTITPTEQQAATNAVNTVKKTKKYTTISDFFSSKRNTAATSS